MPQIQINNEWKNIVQVYFDEVIPSSLHVLHNFPLSNLSTEFKEM